jgi:hypothetical protein
VEHRGRTSGRRCRTPVVALRIDDGYFISPPLRAKRDRVKNVLAADSCTVERAGQRIARTEPALLRQREGTAPLRWPVWDRPRLLHVGPLQLSMG